MNFYGSLPAVLVTTNTDPHAAGVDRSVLPVGTEWLPSSADEAEDNGQWEVEKVVKLRVTDAGVEEVSTHMLVICLDGILIKHPNDSALTWAGVRQVGRLRGVPVGAGSQLLRRGACRLL
jgi:hypothetical protein